MKPDYKNWIPKGMLYSLIAGTVLSLALLLVFGAFGIGVSGKLRRLPLSFFGQRDLSDLTSTMMGDCSKLERIFSNAVPGLFGTIVMFLVVSACLLCVDWRMGLCIVLPVPGTGKRTDAQAHIETDVAIGWTQVDEVAEANGDDTAHSHSWQQASRNAEDGREAHG